MTHLDVWRDSLPCVTWLVVTWLVHAWHRRIRVCVTWLTHFCDVPHFHVWRKSVSIDSFTWVPWFIHMCDVTHSHVWHDSFTCVTWLIHMCDVTQSHVWRDSFTYVMWFVMAWLVHAHSPMCDVTCLICMCVVTHFDLTHPHMTQAHSRVRDVTHSDLWRDSFTCVRRDYSYVWDMTHPHAALLMEILVTVPWLVTVFRWSITRLRCNWTETCR